MNVSVLTRPVASRARPKIPDIQIRNLKSWQIKCNEKWSFCYTKQKIMVKYGISTQRSGGCVVMDSDRD